MSDGWDPRQYDRFKAERRAPFDDLLRLVEPVPGGRVVDLGCGTGELTRALHLHTGAATTVGIDSSPAMLAEAAAVSGDGISFELGDIAAVDGGAYEVVLANASLQWVPDHPAVLRRWTAALAPAGQLAVQVPANADHPSHLTAAEVAAEEPFASAFDENGGPPPDPVRRVLPPEHYAELLDELGYDEQHVRLQVYGHRLASTEEVVEWVKGTSLTRFKTRLPADIYERFLDEYGRRLLQRLGHREPYFYAFKRILFWGRRPA